MDADLEAYRSKPLSDDIVFLFLDGISQNVREIGVEGKVMLCAFGIHADGTKELLSFRLTEVEDAENWRGFLVGLKSRGLKGQALKLIVVDGNAALLRALREIYPLRRIQRCIAHKLRNVVVKLKRAQRAPCMAGAKRIFGTPLGERRSRASRPGVISGSTKPRPPCVVWKKICFLVSTTIASRRSSGGPFGPPTSWSGIFGKSGEGADP